MTLTPPENLIPPVGAVSNRAQGNEENTRDII